MLSWQNGAAHFPRSEYCIILFFSLHLKTLIVRLSHTTQKLARGKQAVPLEDREREWKRRKIVFAARQKERERERQKETKIGGKRKKEWKEKTRQKIGREEREREKREREERENNLIKELVRKRERGKRKTKGEQRLEL
jgi:hypothetical protein